MFATRSLFIIGIFCFSSAICERVVCDFEDSKCLTETADLTFKEFVAGTPGVVETSDPLYVKYIEGNLPTLAYKFFDTNVRGMKNCKVDLVRISPKDLKYDYHVGCPHLTMEAQYEIKGEVGPQHIEGKGDSKIDFYNYNFHFNGDYSSFEDKEGMSHINLKTHDLEIVTDGKVVYEFKNLFDGDKAKSEEMHKYLNANSKEVDSSTRGPAMIAIGGEKKACDFEDSKCLTEAARRVFVQIISGMPGVETSDPLHEDLIEADMPSLNYKIIDGYLFGLRNCQVELVKIYTKEQEYDYHLGCPHLTLESGYDLMAETGTKVVKGKGTSKIDLYDYHLLFHGDFALNEDEEGQMHLNLKTHKLALKIKGKVHYNYKNVLIEDREKSDALQKYANENWKSIVKTTLPLVMEKFMNKHINNKNAFLTIVPIQDIFYSEN
ncbi:hypothetical protein PYW08_003135 [Mythimna loreyi]|uniref:Uncharacterized protein n=1 Tax=Mythimna loreyi TaxID=667449 RepID=A0ACC2QVF6_9NEOP|nr:hypothetical protein PYW08_003135 [Mythimna loreyi]